MKKEKKASEIAFINSINYLLYMLIESFFRRDFNGTYSRARTLKAELFRSSNNKPFLLNEKHLIKSI
jgi:hypothetical protein